ncbi:uncharacterized protein LOC143476741 [Brachyhypopomus gauderio]|uniref:uncharacterized protein LOC143476741 n=1 Tax=Brachyhypopomus gauderio TaxID=698409 RepID=UPI00404297BA
MRARRSPAVHLLGLTGNATLFCALCMTQMALLQAEFMLVYLHDGSLLACACTREPEACATVDSSECECDERPFRAHQGPVSARTLTVWYSSPLDAAQLLNNSEVRHLALVMCSAAQGHSPPSDYFMVRRLERLTVSYPARGTGHDVVLGRDMGAPYHEEARIAIIHTPLLMWTSGLKGYTVKTSVDSSGSMPFPNLFMSHDGLPEMSSIFVTFLY